MPRGDVLIVPNRSADCCGGATPTDPVVTPDPDPNSLTIDLRVQAPTIDIVTYPPGFRLIVTGAPGGIPQEPSGVYVAGWEQEPDNSGIWVYRWNSQATYSHL